MEEFQIQAIVYDYLMENPYTNFSNILDRIKEVHRQITGEEELSDGDALAVNNLVWDLITARILTPGADSKNVDWPWLHVSNMGKLSEMMNNDLG